MEQDKNNEEYIDGGEPEIDYDELNRAQANSRYLHGATQDLNLKEINPSETFEKLSSFYQYPPKIKPQFSPQETKKIDVNAIDKFLLIKKEIDLIEKDIAYYKQHPEEYKSEVNIEKTIIELQKLKQIANYIYFSNNFSILKKITELQKEKKKKISKEKFHVLNKKLYEELDTNLYNKVKKINKLKEDNPNNFKNFEYELFIAPDTEKVKQFTKLIEIKQLINSIENKIGEWNFETKQKSIATVVESIRNNLRLFDKEFKSDINLKLEVLNKRIDDIKSGNEDFYNDVDQNKLNSLYSSFTSPKDVEQVIFNTIAKMESLQNNHEESAFISLKLKELIEQQEDIAISIDESELILDNLKKNLKQNSSVIRKNIETIKNKLK